MVDEQFSCPAVYVLLVITGLPSLCFHPSIPPGLREFFRATPVRGSPRVVYRKNSGEDLCDWGPDVESLEELEDVRMELHSLGN